MSLILKTYIEYDRFVPVERFAGGQSCWDLSKDYFMSETYSPQFLERVMQFFEKRKQFSRKPEDAMRDRFGPLLTEIDDEMIDEGRVGWVTANQFIDRWSKLDVDELYAGDRILNGVVSSIASEIEKEHARIIMVAY